MINKFDTFLFGIIATLMLATSLYCGWFVYDTLDFRIQKLEEQQETISIAIWGK